MSRVQDANLADFTGGLNLRADAFTLAANESPSMLNVEVDPRGGFYSRMGWTKTNATDIDTGVAAWDPRRLIAHQLADDSVNMYLVNGADDIYFSDDLGATWPTSGGQTPTASPHGIDMAAWGDIIYSVAGPTAAAAKYGSTGVKTLITQAEAATFSPVTAPTTAFPRGSHLVTHLGYMFAAATEEDGVEYPTRLRWSHPNDPEAWASADVLDLNQGGGKITALVSNGDHLLIFQESAISALFGSDSDSWQRVDVDINMGTISPQHVTQSELGVFFFVKDEGVYLISGTQKPVEVSESLRPMFDSSNFNPLVQDEIWLGWADKRLWVSLPFGGGLTVPTTAETTFVLDPSLGGGSWVLFRGASGQTIGPFVEFGGSLEIAAAREAKRTVTTGENERPVDDLDGWPANFESFYVTRWMNGGKPTLKKSWRRPDFVAKSRSLAYEMTVDVFTDYDPNNIQRTKLLSVPAGGTGAAWGGFNWGDGTVFGPPANGAKIERGGNLGSAKSVSLKLSGALGFAWGVDAIVFKIIPRRMR